MSEPKNNPLVGRPLRFKTVKQLQDEIDEYFDYCDRRIRQEWSEKKQEVVHAVSPAPYTMSGLARRLDISRETLVQYGHKDKYSDAVIRARERVQEDVENRMMETKNEKGAQFSLKNNFGWKDKTETEHSGDIQIVFHDSLKQSK